MVLFHFIFIASSDTVTVLLKFDNLVLLLTLLELLIIFHVEM